jgi:CBS domain containing-hemolysin-like protein
MGKWSSLVSSVVSISVSITAFAAVSSSSTSIVDEAERRLAILHRSNPKREEAAIASIERAAAVALCQVRYPP